MTDLADTFTNRVADWPERIPLVPPTLADFECGHGYIGGCPVCGSELRNEHYDLRNELRGLERTLHSRTDHLA